MSTRDLSVRAVWIPFILLAATNVSAIIIFEINREHRLTVMEESIRNQARIMNEHIVEQQRTLEAMREQLEMTGRVIEKLADLEEFFHGMSPDELKAFRNRKGRQ